jgi:hypothetical protein
VKGYSDEAPSCFRPDLKGYSVHQTVFVNPNCIAGCIEHTAIIRNIFSGENTEWPYSSYDKP